jgi:redox-sensitive bicupin YhaK (pirin superfamily)
MYHGRVVPGFPQHPHRGFETVTYARQGYIDHSDSLGATARFGRGDVQWMTAGKGIVHSEMFPLLDRDGPNPVELFQIWLNLPAANKLVVPHFTMLWDDRIPRLEPDAGVEVTVIAGALEGLVPPPPPPHSWARSADHDVAIWHVTIAPGARWTLPAAGFSDTVRTLYVFAGAALSIAGRTVDAGHGALVRSDVALDLTSADGVEVLMLQGRPIGEPVAQYGPFVMNQRAEIQQAVEDYQRTGFGGWPWPVDDPVHGAEQGRFARHADGRLEEK